jgi:alkylation response protein AidB-like acyl-CoA dehydrogenase
MPEYRAPIDDIRFVLNELAGLPRLTATVAAYQSATPDVVDSILVEAAKLAGEVISPLNRSGDLKGVELRDGRVHVPDGFAEAYRAFASGGWVGVRGDPEHGGQGLPHALSAPTSEMWAAANTAFATCPELSSGAVEALETHATPELRDLYMPRMLSGEWTVTMCLTEPQAGSDLAVIQTRAEPHGDRFRLFGRKIFITWGDHELTPNIVHMVLAKAPHAPPGVKGISLFLVPKYRVAPDGKLGERNDIHPVSVEHKLGLHASPTCVLALGDHGGAEGFLVGRLHEGLACMFTMMNCMRLGVGLQGIGIADRAYQHAVAYARERVQGRSTDGKERVAIIRHADVRRMLLTMRALTEASRALAYVAAVHLDFAKHAPDPEERRRHQARADLLTPIVKAWGSEIAQEATGLCVQIHGGSGFIEETGVAQYLRDARITTIYEGTNGIQALDLVGRKVLRDGGGALEDMLSEMRNDQKALAGGDAALERMANALGAGVREVGECVRLLLRNSATDQNFPGAVAFNFLMMVAIVAGGWQMARAALVANRKLGAKEGDTSFLRAKLATAHFYADHVLPRALAHAAAVQAGSASVMELEEDQF